MEEPKTIEELKKEMRKWHQGFIPNSDIDYLIDHAAQIERDRIIGVIESRIKLCEDLETYRGCSPKMQADFSAKKTELISLKSFLSTSTPGKECEWEEVKGREGFGYKTSCGHYRYKIPKNLICDSGNPVCGKPIKVKEVQNGNNV